MISHFFVRDHQIHRYFSASSILNRIERIIKYTKSNLTPFERKEKVLNYPMSTVLIV